MCFFVFKKKKFLQMMCAGCGSCHPQRSVEILTGLLLLGFHVKKAPGRKEEKSVSFAFHLGSTVVGNTEKGGGEFSLYTVSLSD